MVFCDNRPCEFNCKGRCSRRDMHYIGKLCRDYHRLDVKRLMQPPYRANCHKRNGKYVSDGAGAQG